MILEPGMEVECIDDRFNGFYHRSGIRKGSKYIISEVHPDAIWNNEPYIGVVLIGVIYDIPLYAHRFQPIKKTDIGVFTELLKTKEEELV